MCTGLRRQRVAPIGLKSRREDGFCSFGSMLAGLGQLAHHPVTASPSQLQSKLVEAEKISSWGRLRTAGFPWTETQKQEAFLTFRQKQSLP